MERRRSQDESLNANEAFVERRYFEAGRLSAEETLALFRATFASPSGQKVLAELMRRWHFFDPILEKPEHVQKRRCIMEILILSGMWHPGGMDHMASACTAQAKPGWVGRMIETLRTIPLQRKTDHA
jgi:hypothetical protein